MSEATNAQMQVYCDTRVRPRAEAFRGLYLACKDDKAVIDDEYLRATTNPPVLGRWNDARADGPPHLLASGYSALNTPANPDDLTNYNALITAFITIIEGTNTAQDAANAATIRANWPVLQRACVRPPTG